MSGGHTVPGYITEAPIYTVTTTTELKLYVGQIDTDLTSIGTGFIYNETYDFQIGKLAKSRQKGDLPKNAVRKYFALKKLKGAEKKTAAKMANEAVLAYGIMKNMFANVPEEECKNGNVFVYKVCGRATALMCVTEDKKRNCVCVDYLLASPLVTGAVGVCCEYLLNVSVSRYGNPSLSLDPLNQGLRELYAHMGFVEDQKRHDFVLNAKDKPAVWVCVGDEWRYKRTQNKKYLG